MLSHHVGRYMYVGCSTCWMEDGDRMGQRERRERVREKERECEGGRERGGRGREGVRERERERERDWRPWDIGSLPTCRTKPLLCKVLNFFIWYDNYVCT